MIKILKNTIFTIIYILIIIYLIIFIPCLWGQNPLIIVSGSMEPILNVGGILYYGKSSVNDLKEGDILVYKYENHNIAHRIIVKNDNYFITKGDANNSYDFYKVDNNQVLGKGSDWCIPYLGYYADYIYHHKYLLLIIFGFVCMDIVNSRKESKNEKNT